PVVKRGPHPIGLSLLANDPRMLSDEELDVLPEAGSLERARQMVRARKVEERAQDEIRKKYERISNEDLDKKIARVRQELKGRPESESKTLQRLEKERARRRALPVTSPNTADQAIS